MSGTESTGPTQTPATQTHSESEEPPWSDSCSSEALLWAPAEGKEQLGPLAGSGFPCGEAVVIDLEAADQCAMDSGAAAAEAAAHVASAGHACGSAAELPAASSEAALAPQQAAAKLQGATSPQESSGTGRGHGCSSPGADADVDDEVSLAEFMAARGRRKAVVRGPGAAEAPGALEVAASASSIGSTSTAIRRRWVCQVIG